MKQLVIQVYKDNRITLPATLLHKWGLKTGDYVIVEELSDGIKLIPAQIRPRRLSK